MAKKKTVPKRTYCPLCHISIANGSKNVIQTGEGPAHYNCTLDFVTKELKKIGIPRHKFSEQTEMKRFLWQQAKALLEKPASPIVEKRLRVIIRISKEFFGFEIRISKLVA